MEDRAQPLQGRGDPRPGAHEVVGAGGGHPPVAYGGDVGPPGAQGGGQVGPVVRIQSGCRASTISSERGPEARPRSWATFVAPHAASMSSRSEPGPSTCSGSTCPTMSTLGPGPPSVRRAASSARRKSAARFIACSVPMTPARRSTLEARCPRVALSSGRTAGKCVATSASEDRKRVRSTRIRSGSTVRIASRFTGITETRGREATNGGRSQWGETATRRSVAPSQSTISVMPGRVLTIRRGSAGRRIVRPSWKNTVRVLPSVRMARTKSARGGGRSSASRRHRGTSSTSTATSTTASPARFFTRPPPGARAPDPPTRGGPARGRGPRRRRPPGPRSGPPAGVPSATTRPATSRTIRSATRAARLRSCSAARTPAPARARARNRARIRRRWPRSRCAVGSSRRSRSPPWTRHRARVARRRSPLESEVTGRSASAVRSTSATASSIARSSSSERGEKGPRQGWRPSEMLSRTVKGNCCSSSAPTPAIRRAASRRGRAPTGAPSTITAPRVGARSPDARRRSVLLPAPLGPTRATVSPPVTSRSMPARASRRP